VSTVEPLSAGFGVRSCRRCWVVAAIGVNLHKTFLRPGLAAACRELVERRPRGYWLRSERREAAAAKQGEKIDLTPRHKARRRNEFLAPLRLCVRSLHLHSGEKEVLPATRTRLASAGV
jgi:hypothetical protein